MSPFALRSIDGLRGPSTADLVYDELYRRIVEGDLPPGARISEQDVARQIGSSRQPVRDAFYRLSKLGLVQVQPQRATVVALFSEDAVLQARFVRTALETETARIAAGGLPEAALDELDRNLFLQEAAVAADDRIGFHGLDDGFHAAICAAAGHAFAWALIRENKAHMDRVRWRSLAFGARAALDDHHLILGAIRARDPDAAAAAMRAHLGRIVDFVADMRRQHPELFAPEAPVREPS